eukprot:TRINITY_DN50853_c0_g1_i1.p2 TRINITY_DN50853_c0_g1~~TRINITY_DN50853_c0_g1_i1.p2  ORF type:complete len:122 (-),score=11.04 TRINITY_DN50853_c0_g1_i1:412-777(-)
MCIRDRHHGITHRYERNFFFALCDDDRLIICPIEGFSVIFRLRRDNCIAGQLKGHIALRSVVVVLKASFVSTQLFFYFLCRVLKCDVGLVRLSSSLKADSLIGVKRYVYSVEVPFFHECGC